MATTTSVRCALCAQVIRAAAYTIVCQRASGVTLTVNMDRLCIRDLFGPGLVNKLDAVLDRSGWIQEPLPEIG